MEWSIETESFLEVPVEGISFLQDPELTLPRDTKPLSTGSLESPESIPGLSR